MSSFLGLRQSGCISCTHIGFPNPYSLSQSVPWRLYLSYDEWISPPKACRVSVCQGVHNTVGQNSQATQAVIAIKKIRSKWSSGVRSFGSEFPLPSCENREDNGWYANRRKSLKIIRAGAWPTVTNHLYPWQTGRDQLLVSWITEGDFRWCYHASPCSSYRDTLERAASSFASNPRATVRAGIFGKSSWCFRFEVSMLIGI